MCLLPKVIALSLSNLSLKKFMDFKSWKKNEMMKNSPKWPYLEHQFSKFLLASMFPDPPKGASTLSSDNYSFQPFS